VNKPQTARKPPEKSPSADRKSIGLRRLATGMQTMNRPPVLPVGRISIRTQL
jgi:hypothetical protein